MAIKAYTGIMGSGKTYEVVSVVIKNALAQGRRVVSNIAGLNLEAFKTVLVEDGIDPAKIGELVHVDHDKVLDPMFWRTDKDGPEVVTVIQPGDLVVLDEIWRFWDGFGPKDADGKKRPDRVQNFFRMHRQFPHPVTGLTCDLAVICQDIMDAHRSLRAVIEETYLMTKLTVIGSSSRYRVDVFQRTKTRGRPSSSLQRSYNPKYFPLYSSHSQKKEGGADAKEVNIDDRGNILKGALFKVILPLMIPLFGAAIWVVWGFFHPASKEAKPKKDQVEAVADSKPMAAQPNRPNPPEISPQWRIAGWYSVNGILRVVLSDGENIRYLVDPPATKQTAVSLEVLLPEGGFATEQSGGKAGTGLIPPAPENKS